MPVRNIGRYLRVAMKQAAMGELRRVVLVGGLQYGRLGEVVDGVSSFAPRVSMSAVLAEGALTWRTASPTPLLKAPGAVRRSRENGDEFSFEYVDASLESAQGTLPQCDVQYALVQPTSPTTMDHGYVVDGCFINSAKGLEGCTQIVTGLPNIAGQTWTLSFYVACVDPFQLAPGATQVRVAVQRGDGSDSASTVLTYSGAGKYQRLTYTRAAFSGTAGTSIKVIFSPISTGVGLNPTVTPLLVCAAQLELAGSATAYERTGAVAGARNVLLESHFPTRSPWTVTGSNFFLYPDAGRGPEVRAIVPTPGTLEFGVGTIGVAFPDGLLQLEPVDTYGQTADKFVTTAAANSGVYRSVGGLSPSTKTYIASIWVRHTGASIPANGFSIDIQARNSGALVSNSAQNFAVTKAWRRVWWVYTVPSSTCNEIQVFFYVPTSTIGDTLEIFGAQLEEVTSAKPPANYVPTTTAASGVNLFARSAEFSDAYWSKQTATVTANTGYGPVEYYDALHPSLGVAPTRMRVNEWANTPAAEPWEWPETSFNMTRDNLLGMALSIGSYGAEKLGTAGDLTWVDDRIPFYAGRCEVWTSSTNLANAIEAVAGGNTINQEMNPLHVAVGTYAARTDRVDGGVYTGLEFTNINLVPSAYYRISLRHKQSHASMTAGPELPVRVVLSNNTKTKELNSSGSWVAPGVNCIYQNGSTQYVQYTFFFQFDPTFAVTDVCQLKLGPYFDAGKSVWWDDVKIEGPYDSLGNPVNPDGWTVGGTASRVRMASALPDIWLDDEESTTPEGAYFDAVDVELAPAGYLQKTVTLTAGWHTVRARLAGGGTAAQTGLRMSVKRTTDNFYAENDMVRFLGTTERWTSPRGFRQWSDVPPSFAVAVWHLHVPTSTDYVFRFGVIQNTSSGTTTLAFDQVRIWDQAGALYASPADRLETKGNIGALVQGLNVQFRGVADDVQDGQEDGVRVRCRDYVHGTDQRLPVETTRPECQLGFRGAECGYVQTTTFTGSSGGGTTHTCADTSLLEKGRYIKPKTYAGVAHRIANILSATQFTTDQPDTFVNGDALVYVDCRKVYADCSRRQRTHRYLGTRATASLQASIGTPYTRMIGPQPRPYSAEYDGPIEIIRSTAALMRALTISGQGALNEKRIFDDRAVNIVYGRKSVKLAPIESHATKFTTDNSEWLTTFYLIGWGELEDVRLFFTPEGPVQHNYSGGVGVYWHPGLQGEDAWWTLTDHGGATATQKINNQKRDFRTNTDNTYNRMAYAILQLKSGNPQADLLDPTKVIELWADVKGRKVQAYNSGGRAQGSPAWSRNPAWIMVDILTNRLFGPGFPASLIDWYSFKATADACAAQITSGSAKTTVRTGANSAVQQVTSVADFAPEMSVYIGADPPGAANAKVLFIDPINQRLFLDTVVNSTTGWVVQGYPARYTCDLNIAAASPLATIIDQILSTCRGMLTFDGGKIGMQVEASKGAATGWALTTPTPAASLLGIVPDSFRLNQRRGDKQAYNVMEVSYESGQLLAGVARTARFTDADQGGLDFPRPIKIDASGCDTADQALRATLPKFAKMSAMKATGGEAAVGFSIASGPAMLAAQVGDVVTVTRPNRPNIGSTRIQSITVNPDLRVDVECVPENAAVRPEGFIPTFDPFTDDPSAAAEQGTHVAPAGITLTVVQSAAAQLKATVGLTGYAAGPGTSAGTHMQTLAGLELHASTSPGFTPAFGKHRMGGTHIAWIDPLSREFIWNVPSSRLEVPLYFKVVGYQGHIWQNPVFSNEVGPTTVYRVTRDTTDPTQNQVTSMLNMVYDGDFKGSAFNDSGVTLNGDGWSTNSDVGYTRVAPNAHTTPSSVAHAGTGSDIAFTNPANGYDNTALTYATGGGNWVAASDTDNVASIQFKFAAATKTGRIKVRLKCSNATAGEVEIRYSTNGTGGPYTTLAHAHNTSDQDFFGPRMVSQNMANLVIEVIAWPRMSDPGNSQTASIDEVQFDEETAGNIVAQIVDDHLELRGNTGTNYAQAVRRFPTKNPPASGTYLTSNSLNTVRIRVRNHTAGVAANANVEVRIEDAGLGTSWTLLTVTSGEITDSWQDFGVLFDPGGTPVAGQLSIVVRYAGTNMVDCDWLWVCRGEQLVAFNLSPEEQAVGRHPDLRAGETKQWPKGSWVANTSRKSVVG